MSSITKPLCGKRLPSLGVVEDFFLLSKQMIIPPKPNTSSDFPDEK
jgi:hypothetical protein